MPATLPVPEVRPSKKKPAPAARTAVPPLENGARLSAKEFLRRYEAMPEVRKAELIDGIVYLDTLPVADPRGDYLPMASPVRIEQHGEPDGLLQGWLCVYAAATPGVRHATNATAKLAPRQVPQPDGLLRLLPGVGGQAFVDGDGYLRGAPELAVEVAASTVSKDLHQKKRAYRRFGVREYLVWRVEDATVDWWTRADAAAASAPHFTPLVPDADGRRRSRVFPGLWLDANALLAGDGARLLAASHAGLASPEHAAFAAELRGRAAVP